MADYPINKGIGHSVEFKGLKAQYLFIFAGGLLAVFFLVVVLYMAGADQLVCIGLGLTLGSLLVWGTFRLSGNLVGISINLCKSIQKELFINNTP